LEYQLRPIVQEEFQRFGEANSTAFGYVWRPDRSEDAEKVFEFERSLAAIDGDEILSTAGIFSFEMTTPGGALPVAGVTWVGVRPTHRRRGILTAMMRRQLDDVRERGEAVAALWASESVIYGRFGYGMAAQQETFSILRSHSALAHGLPSDGRTRFVDRETAIEQWPAAYERVWAGRPGFMSRNETWWRHHALPERDRRLSDHRGPFYVQYEEAGEVLGYAAYGVQDPETADGQPASRLTVVHLQAATHAANCALWRFIFGVDLVERIDAWWRPLDDALPWMLADPRRLTRRVSDSLWLRPVDVSAMLEARRYSFEGQLTFDVRDNFGDWAEGRYVLEGGADGARCRRTRAEPTFSLEAADLGAIFLGGARLQTLAAAGRVQGDAAALRQADLMFSWSVAPWCPEVF
jgi:predicted acetyltransferase